MSENCQRYCLNRPTNGKKRGNMQTIAFRLKVVHLKRRTWHTCETSTWNNSHIFWCNQFWCSLFTVNNETQNCDLCFFGCSTKVRWNKMNSLSLFLFYMNFEWNECGWNLLTQCLEPNKHSLCQLLNILKNHTFKWAATRKIMSAFIIFNLSLFLSSYFFD